MNGDFINVEAVAEAVARRIQIQVPSEQRLFELERAAKYCGMPVESSRKKVIRYRIPKVRLDKC